MRRRPDLPPARPQTWLTVARLGTALAVWLAAFPPLQGAGIPEPDTVFYGKVSNSSAGYELPVTEGALEWTIQLEQDASRKLVLRTPLEPLADGQFSYRLKVPHEAVATGFATTDLSPGTVALAPAADRYRHVEVRVNGILARILPPAPEVFDVAQGRRLATHRLDLEVLLDNPDSDRDGLPDWWEQRFGLDKFADDADADLDRDGLSNLREFQLRTDPTASNQAPTIVWENTAVSEGGTEVITIQTVDSDTPPDQLVYTLVQAPVGAHFRVLFGATAPGPDGRIGDRELQAGDTFTQAQVNAGELVVTHDDPDAHSLDFRLRVTDGDALHAPYEAAITLHVHQPSTDDGTGAALWLDARYAAAKSGTNALTVWPDRSGAKPWLGGANAPFDARAGSIPVALAGEGPRGQPVAAFNLPGVPLPPVLPGEPASQFLALPSPDEARVFHQGDLTVFAVFKSLGTGHEREQIVSGTQFQFGLTGAQNHGRDSQVRFASERGAVYGNRDIHGSWVLATAWQEQDAMSVELNGLWTGGPRPLDEPTPYGTDPLVAGRAGLESGGRRVDQYFEGYLAELLVFNRSIEDVERKRVNCALLSKWFGWIVLDGTEESRDLDWRVASSGLSAAAYRTNFMTAYGPDHNYILLGGAGSDTLRGGMNDDLMVGGLGSDWMTGGGGKDVFVFNHVDQGSGQDTITDFRPRDDHDVLDIANTLRGTSRDLRDYARLRTDGHHSHLDLDFAGERKYADHTIELQNTVLRNEDLYELWARGNLITGDKRFPLPVSLAVSQATGIEITGEPAILNLHFGGQSVPDGLEIPFELSGSAERGVDYTLSVRTYHEATDTYDWEPVTGHELFVREKVGDLDFAIRVEPILDERAEGPETVRLHLTPVPEFFDLEIAEATVTIEDGPQRVSVTASDNAASETGDPGVFTLRREGSLDVPLDVRIQMTGPAQNGTDYAFLPSAIHFAAGQSAVTMTLTPYPDDVRELPEAAELVIQPGAGYFADVSKQAATVMIQDVGAVITVELLQPLAVVQDGTLGAFLLRRQGVVSENLTVFLEVSGSAAASRDYRRIDRFVTLAPGVTTAVIKVEPLAGAVISDGAESVTVAVLPDAAYALGIQQRAEVRIVPTLIDFAQWKNSRFPGDTTPPALFPGLDFDDDGISNGAEYGFGLDPRAADPHPAGAPRAVLIDDRLGIRFTRPVAAVDTEYFIETSIDLQTWQAADTDFGQVSSRLAGNGNEEVTWLDRSPVSEFARRFVRLQVQIR